MSDLVNKPKLPEKTLQEVAAEKATANENDRMKRDKYEKEQRLLRGRYGRLSLISGSEQGVKDTLG